MVAATERHVSTQSIKNQLYRSSLYALQESQKRLMFWAQKHQNLKIVLFNVLLNLTCADLCSSMKKKRVLILYTGFLFTLDETLILKVKKTRRKYSTKAKYMAFSQTAKKKGF